MKIPASARSSRATALSLVLAPLLAIALVTWLTPAVASGAPIEPVVTDSAGSGYEILYFYSHTGVYTWEATKTTSPEASGDRYDFHTTFICNSGYQGKQIYVTLEYDTGGGFQTYYTYPVPLDNIGCSGGQEGVFEFLAFIDGMGSGSEFRVSVSDPDGGIFDFLGDFPWSYIEWNT